MITPKVSFDWTTGSAQAGVDVTRAGTATYVDSNGLIQVASANTQRIDYSTVTPKLLIEESRTNNLSRSNDFAQAVWIKSNSTVSSAAGIAPDGTMTAWKVIPDAGVVGGFYRDPGLNGVSTLSFFAKEDEWRYILVQRGGGYSPASAARIDLRTGSLATGSGWVTVPYKDGWWRIYNTSTFTAGDRIVYFTATNSPTFPQTNGDGTSGILIAFAQAEAGAFITSYIPTTNTTVTRNADVATITGANFSNFWQANKGGLQVLARQSVVSGTRPLVQFDDNTANNIIALQGNATDPELYIVDGGAPQAQIDAGTIAANTDYTLTGWWETDDCKARLNSGSVFTDTTASIPTVTQARIGSDGTNYLNGHIAKIDYYDRFSSQIYTRRKNKVISTLL